MKLQLLFPVFVLYTLAITAQNTQHPLPEHLNAVVTHYKTTKAPLKAEAAMFLIKHMPIHYFEDYNWVNPNGDSIAIEETNYANTEEFIDVLNHLKDSLNIRAHKFTVKDIDAVTTAMLIKNIDAAFLEWQNNPWSQHYDFKTFCEYILPYRSLIEPLSDWRTAYKTLVQDGKHHVKDITDPLDVTTHTILELSEFAFPNEIQNPIPLLSAKHLLFRKRGSCPDLANLALFACRAIGLAVSFDFTPHHAASSNRHYWNTVVDRNGKHVPFNGNAYGNTKGLPGVYTPNNKRIGKVFRRTYAIQEHALATTVPLKRIPNCFLNTKNIIDVTKEYVDTAPLYYKPQRSKNLPDIGYLNVFNHGDWRIVDWGKKKGKQFVYKNLGTDIVYLPSTYYNGIMHYETYPVLLDVSKKSRVLKPNFKKTFSTTLSRGHEVTNQYKDTNTLDIEDGKTYTLYFYENGWQKLQTATASGSGVKFNTIPTDALFWLLPTKNDGFERIFTISTTSKKIVWY